MASCPFAQALNGKPDPGGASRDVAKKFGVRSKSTVNDHRNGKCSCTGPAAEAGETETHHADGSSDYTRFSDRPWGENDFRAFLASTGTDPDAVTFSHGWTSNATGTGFWNKLNNVRKKATSALESLDLPALYAEAENLRNKPRVKRDSKRTTVVVWSDPQVGKTGSRGGTKELIERSERIRGELSWQLTSRSPEHVVILDGGDGIEGFESGGSPLVTNDLSLPAMLDLYATELLRWVKVAHDHAPVTVGVVPSNHAAWRNGKQNLGKPEDDFGLYVHQQVQKITEAASLDVSWERSAPYDESLTIDVRGTKIGLVHGHQFAPGKAVDWWQGQAFGNQAVALADVLVTAHYHSFGAGVAGRNPATNAQRWWLGAPTLDNGSDWYRNIKGRDSDPGLMIFDVTDDGFDLGSLTILTA